jgi:hypothetical protein
MKMATIIAPPEERTNHASNHLSGKTTRRARPAGEEESALGARFFFSKPGMDGSSVELGREFASEGEARVEALKLGVTYYSVREWRPVADLAGKNPELKREAVTGRGTSNAPG